MTAAITSPSNSPALPAGWRVNDCPSGGVDLRALGNRRRVSLVFAALAVVMIWGAAIHWSAPDGRVWAILAAFLVLLSLWTGFGDEVWHLERNSLVHRFGIGSLGYSRRFQDAELEIAYRTSTKFNIPYGRVYVIADGARHFLLDRRDRKSVV